MLLGFEVGGCMGQWLVVVLWAAVEAWAVLEEVAWGWVAQGAGALLPAAPSRDGSSCSATGELVHHPVRQRVFIGCT